MTKLMFLKRGLEQIYRAKQDYQDGTPIGDKLAAMIQDLRKLIQEEERNYQP